MQAAYNGYLAERRVELADGTWKISEDGTQVEIPRAKRAFQCCIPIVDPLSLAYQVQILKSQPPIKLTRCLHDGTDG